jgi:tRNA nucleotidyltransferase (CCA-adding enzyme)
MLEGLRVYQVGGSVRDRLLGLAADDQDFVVVGATPEELVSRGFRSVGKDFPVFLHPISGEEYALARTERKQGPGYHGFSFDAGVEVTLEEDLARRDLTINAMALDAEGQLIDPYNGRLDLQAGCLRHVTEAFREDPVRILRLARFAARFSDFDIAPKTRELCRQMVQSGEVDHLVPERVWQEMSRAMMQKSPSRFFDVLREVGALASVSPELADLLGYPAGGRLPLRALDGAARLGAPLPVRYAVLVCSIPDSLESLARRLRVPSACRDMAELVAACCSPINQVKTLDAETALAVLQRLDVFRRPERMKDVLLACQADAMAREDGTGDANVYPPAQCWEALLQAASSVDGGRLHRQGLRGAEVAQALKKQRLEAIETVLNNGG